ncbi:hypothetical protein EVX74_018055 (plasmid) [Acinetobacter lwoffii]|uniref:Uncharacterized protein n=1 Tax=Acinetobacter lwoffii TaxID=28090 RepID=A0AAJ4TVA2_ACILW|nr:hypothetical protein EVX74_018055 [Acinetobacter lwoffii]HEF0010804.1 hypothetical protein [Citrobacter braakii]
MFGWFKKNEEIPVQPSLDITPTPEMIREEEELLNQFLMHFIEKLSSSPELNKDKINEINDLIKSNLRAFERKEVKKLLNTGIPLTAIQKKELGFNSRLKICEDYLKFININETNKDDPFEFLVDAEFYARARSWSLRDIQQAKNIGSKKIKLSVDEQTCPQSVKAKKFYIVNDAPLLPLKTCGNRCTCMYTAVVEWD